MVCNTNKIIGLKQVELVLIYLCLSLGYQNALFRPYAASHSRRSLSLPTLTPSGQTRYNLFFFLRPEQGSWVDLYRVSDSMELGRMV
jgi:hypothetical protein